MLTSFEDITQALNEDELALIESLIKGFSMHGKGNPIKAPAIVRAMNDYIQNEGKFKKKFKFSEVRLRKCVHHIRANSLLPLMATSDGYFVSKDVEDINAQIKSLNQRAASIKGCAEGLAKFLPGEASGDLFNEQKT